ncbi:hypothetical protein J8273_4114 [Carpediemonas membranifera]|uniref:Uncharacterized protein n=1 Tax=Carpediemonas membranifera TaxID=201153 RepID=A0A8J6E021_9EUKA|nr:hypothetical protein J8273_4114 [Carpediemonas membranifera]|eukprot:KAG9394449.1 hypothetical protein J8273_4114 [Carpediemonas membranifera]
MVSFEKYLIDGLTVSIIEICGIRVLFHIDSVCDSMLPALDTSKVHAVLVSNSVALIQCISLMDKHPELEDCHVHIPYDLLSAFVSHNEPPPCYPVFRSVYPGEDVTLFGILTVTSLETELETVKDSACRMCCCWLLSVAHKRHIYVHNGCHHHSCIPTVAYYNDPASFTLEGGMYMSAYTRLALVDTIFDTQVDVGLVCDNTSNIMRIQAFTQMPMLFLAAKPDGIHTTEYAAGKYGSVVGPRLSVPELDPAEVPAQYLAATLHSDRATAVLYEETGIAVLDSARDSREFMTRQVQSDTGFQAPTESTLSAAGFERTAPATVGPVRVSPFVGPDGTSVLVPEERARVCIRGSSVSAVAAAMAAVCPGAEQRLKG